MASEKIPDEIIKEIVGYIVSTPKMLGGILCSYFLGHIFVYLTVAHIKKNSKGNNILNSYPAKIALGTCWICLISLPVYWISFDDIRLEYNKFLEILPPVVILSFALQLPIYLLVARWGR